VEAPPLQADDILLRHVLVAGGDQRGELLADSERRLLLLEPLDRVPLEDEVPVDRRLFAPLSRNGAHASDSPTSAGGTSRFPVSTRRAPPREPPGSPVPPPAVRCVDSRSAAPRSSGRSAAAPAAACGVLVRRRRVVPTIETHVTHTATKSKVLRYQAGPIHFSSNSYETSVRTVLMLHLLQYWYGFPLRLRRG